MKRVVLYSPRYDSYLSSVKYNRKTGSYEIELTNYMSKIKIWKSRASAQAQANRILDNNRNMYFEVTEIR